MKRWGLHTIFHLGSLAAVSGMMTTSALATTANGPGEHLSRVNAESTRLAQSQGVLGLGSTDPAVKDLQAMLALMGYYAGSVDGTYTQATMAAVRQFQADAGLEADGIVGPATWQKLLPTPAALANPQDPDVPDPSPGGSAGSPSAGPPDNVAVSGTAGELPVLRLDDYGADVSTLQQRLSALNFYAGPIDGVFGLQTEQAVENFQRQVGLGADGVVGPATWQKLLQ